MANLNLEKSMLSYIKFTNIVDLTSGKGYSLNTSNFQMVDKRFASTGELNFSTSFYFAKPRLVQIFTNSNLDFQVGLISSLFNNTTAIWLECDTANKGERLYTVLKTLFIREILQIVPKSNYNAKSAYFTITW